MTEFALGLKLTGDADGWTNAAQASERAWGKLSEAVGNVQTQATSVLGGLARLGVEAPGPLAIVAAAATGASDSFLSTQNTLMSVASQFPKLAFLAGPVGIAIAAAAAVAGAAWAVFKDKTIDSLGEIDGKAITVAEATSAAFTVAKDAVIDEAKAMASGVADWFSKMPSDAAGAFDYLWQGAETVFSSISDFAGQSFTLIVDTAKAMVAGTLAALPALWEGFKAVLGSIANLAAAAWEAVRTGSTEPLKAALKDVARTAYDASRGVSNAFGEGFKSAVTPAMQAVADRVGSVLTAMKQKVVDTVAATRREAAAAAGLPLTANGGTTGDQESLRQKQALEAALTALTRAGIAARRTLEQDALDDALRALQQNFTLRRITEAQYINETADLQRQKTGRIINALNEERDAVIEQVQSLVQQYVKLDAAGNTKEAEKTRQRIADTLQKQVALDAALVKAESELAAIEGRRATAQEVRMQRERDLQYALDDQLTTYNRSLDEAAAARQFELSLIGKTVEQQAVAKATEQARLEVQRRYNELKQIELQIARQIADGELKGLDELYARRTEKLAEWQAAQQASAQATADATTKVFAEADARIQQGLSDALLNALMAGKNAGKAMLDYLKQEALRAVLKIPVQLVSQGITGAIGSLLGGGGGANLGGIGSLFNIGPDSGILGSVLGSVFGTEASLSTGFGVFQSVLAGTGSVVEGLGAAVSAMGGVLGTLGAMLPVIGPIVAVIAALGFGKDTTGIKFGSDATGRYGDQAANHATFSNALGNFAAEGDPFDKGGTSLLDPFKTQFNQLADQVATFLTDTQLQAVRDRIGKASTDHEQWYDYTDQASLAQAFGAASKELMQRTFAPAFDELDTRVGDMIRNFSGDTDALLKFVDGAIAAKKAIDAMTDAVPGFTISLSAMLAGTDEQRNALATLGTLYAVEASDYVQAARDAVAASKQTVGEALAAQNLKVAELARSLDGSLASAKALADAEQRRLQLLQAVLAEIADAAANVHAMFAKTAENFRMATLTPSQQYEHYDQKAAELLAMLQTATDPTRIKDLAAQYNDTLNAAWNLLSAEQKAQLGGQFGDLADSADKLAQERLAKAQEAAEAEARNLSAQIEVSIEAAMKKVAESMEDAATKLADAADKIDHAADKPIIVHGFLDVSTGQTVPLDRQAGAA